MEAVIFFGFMFSVFIIVMLIGFLWFFRKMSIGGRLLSSLITAVVIGFLSPWIISIPIRMISGISQQRKESVAIAELNYFKDAISGKYSETDIKAHYSKQPLSDHGASLISSDRKTPGSLAYPETVVPPKLIPVFIELFDKYGYLVGDLVNRPETPLEIKLKIAGNPKAYNVSRMASNIDTQPQVLIILSTNKNLDIANCVCKNINAPKEAKQICEIRHSLERNGFLRLEEDVVFSNMFESKKEEQALWMLLVKDNREYVRTWVARSQYTPSKILTILSDDSSDTILQFVFLHANTPLKIRHKIANHFNSNVNTLQIDLCHSSNDEILEAVAKSPYSNRDILKILSQDPHNNIYEAVAANPNATSDILESLSNRESNRQYASSVLRLIAKHPNTPISVLEGLYKQNENKKLKELADRILRKRGIIPSS